MKDVKVIDDLNNWKIVKNLDNVSLGHLLFLWPPSPYLHHSLFKHFTYFGETVDVFSKLGFDVEAIDAGIQTLGRSQLFLKLKHADYLIMPLELYNIRIGLSIARIYKDFKSDGKVIVYGTASNLIPNYIANDGNADYIIATGNFVLSLLSALDYDRSKHKEEYSYFIAKNSNNDLVRQGSQYLVLDSKFWGKPLNSLLPLEEYFKIGKGMLEFTIQIGCPWNCSFCSEKILFKMPNTFYRPINYVIDILKEAEEKGWESVYLSATTFTYDKDYVMKLCKAIKENKITLKLRTDTRVDSIDKELLSEMASAGFTKLSLGVETFEYDIQKAIRKVIEVEKIKRVFSECRNLNIIPRALLMLGLPDQKAQAVKNSVEEIRSWGGEVRLKEYSPIQDLSALDVSNPNAITDVLPSFERLNYRSSSIPGLSRTEYMQLLFPDDFQR